MVHAREAMGRNVWRIREYLKAQKVKNETSSRGHQGQTRAS